MAPVVIEVRILACRNNAAFSAYEIAFCDAPVDTLHSGLPRTGVDGVTARV